MGKEAASATWGTMDAFARSWKAEWEPVMLIWVKGTVQGTTCAKCTGQAQKLSHSISGRSTAWLGMMQREEGMDG